MSAPRRLPAWDDRPRKKALPPKPTAPCPACGRPVISTAKAPRIYCHDGCRQAAQSAAVRMEQWTLKTVDSDSCWLWTGPKNDNGYGTLSIGHRSVLAHRLALELYIGRQLQPGELALHGCDTAACLRPGPGHLYVGDHVRNMVDVHERNRGGGSKTSWDDRVDMAERAQAGEPLAAVGAAFGVTADTVRRWRDHFFP